MAFSSSLIKLRSSHFSLALALLLAALLAIWLLSGSVYSLATDEPEFIPSPQETERPVVEVQQLQASTYHPSLQVQGQLEPYRQSTLTSRINSQVEAWHVRQGQAKGLGHAVLCAQPLVGNEPFAVVLPDVLVDEASCSLNRDNLAEMVKNFDETGHSQVMVEKVPQDDVSKYGIADIGGEELKPGEQAPITQLVEKPSKEEAPSDLAVVGRYVFSADLWPLLEKTPVGAGNEIQLTDAMAMLLEKQSVNAYYMKGKSHDCGNKLGYAQAFIEHAMRHPELGSDMKQYIKSLKGA